MAGPDRPLFARPDFQAVAGRALRPGGTALTESLLDRLARPAGSWVLDVGCGRGATLDLLADRGLRGLGVDLSGELLGQAGRGLRALGSALALPLKPGTFSAVVCECVLSLVEDKPRALAEMARTLAPGGLLGLADLYLRPARNAGAGYGPDSACGVSGRHFVRETPAWPGGLPDQPEGLSGGLRPKSPGPHSGHDIEPGPGRGLGPGQAPSPASAANQPQAAPWAGCPSGALPWSALEPLLLETGFTVLTFEDHSRALAELAGELIFSGLPREALGLCAPGAGRAGYFTCVARKETP